MSKHATWGALAILLASAGFAAAPTPSSAPAATAPATADYSDPKRAVDSFLRALQDGDEPATRAALRVAPQWKQPTDLILGVIFATGRLQKTAMTHFGPAAEKYFGAAPQNMLTARMKVVDTAPVKINGSSALISIPPDDATHQAGGTVLLIKSGNNWKIDAGSLFNFPDMPKAQLDQQTALAAKLIPITEQVAKDIDAGKYPAAMDAYQDFWDKSLEAMKSLDAAAASQPAATQ